jgi:hypothetical protein
MIEATALTEDERRDRRAKRRIAKGNYAATGGEDA